MEPKDPFEGETYPLTVVTTKGETVRGELTPAQALDATAGKAVMFTVVDDEPDLPPAA